MTEEWKPPPLAEGVRVNLEILTAAELGRLAELDWLRSLHPEMAGWIIRHPTQGLWGTSLARARADGRIVGVLDSAPVPGYDGIANVSIVADVKNSRGGLVLEAYGLLVDQLFASGVRRIHHEVLALNGPILRAMGAMKLAPSAHLREHGYAAGRFWDAFVFSYDKAHWDQLLTRVFPRNPFRRDRAATVANTTR